MGYTITEKILLKHTKAKAVRPGEFFNARIDLCLGNDIVDVGKYLAAAIFEGESIVTIETDLGSGCLERDCLIDLG